MGRIFQPLAVFGLTFGFALTAMRYCSRSALMLLLIGVGICALILFLGWLPHRRKAKFLLCTAAVLLAGMTMLSYKQFFFRQSERVIGQHAVIEGRVISSEPIERGRRYEIRTRSITLAGVDATQTLLLYAFGDFWMEPGETVRCAVTFSDQLPNTSQLASGATLIASCTDSKILRPAGQFHQLLNQLRETLRRRINRMLPDPECGLLTAMLLGDRNDLDQTIADGFSQAGILHLLCVSGFHISLITSAFLWVIQKLLGKRRWTYLLGIPAVVFFVLLTGNSPSALRALLMELLRLTAAASHRSYRPANALGLSVLVLCLSSPGMIYHAGFLLSVLSVATIQGSSFLFRNFLQQHQLFQKTLSSLLVTSSVNFASIPILASISGSISLLAPLINLVAIPTFSLAMTVGICGVLLAATPLGSILGRICGLLLSFLITLSQPLPNFWDQIPLGMAFLTPWFWTTVALLAAGWLFWKLRQHRGLIASLSAIIFSAGLFLHTLTTQNVCFLTILQSNSGQSIILHRNQEAVVIGCGNHVSADVVRYLRANGIHTLEALILPDASEMVLGDAAKLLVKIPAARILLPESTNAFDRIVQTAPDAELLPVGHTAYRLFGSITCTIRSGKEHAAILLDTGKTTFCFCHSEALVRYPADQIIFYDILAEKNTATGANYAIIPILDVQPLEQKWLLDCQSKPTLFLRIDG